jgi:hypothetical protein
LLDPGFDHTVLREFRTRLVEGKLAFHTTDIEPSLAKLSEAPVPEIEYAGHSIAVDGTG